MMKTAEAARFLRGINEWRSSAVAAAGVRRG